MSNGEMIGHNRPIEFALKEAEAKLKTKSRQIVHLFENLEKAIETYVHDVFYDNIDNYISKDVVDRPGAKTPEALKPDVKEDIKRFYERFNVSVPIEYLTDEEACERCRVEEANMMAGYGIL